MLVALDGPSGAGKSTLARAVEAKTGIAVIEGDDFYSGAIADVWDAMSVEERIERCIDWRRQRPVLEALRRGEHATWHPYDWKADDGRLASAALSRGPARAAILEGAYSGRPELADLLDLRVLLTAPAELRRERVREREGERYRAEWEARWAAAEDCYFASVVPAERFDLVLDAPDLKQ
ncbi:MAG TPA: AAA family ATPase [Gaiellaceae bacterium]